MLLAIETSCDETAIAVLDLKAFFLGAGGSDECLRADLLASQAKLHEPYGGVVPELASREHSRNLPLLLRQALSKAGVGVEDISVVAVTSGPGLKGCLLVGFCFAKAFAFARNIPLVSVNHLEAHLYAGELLPAEERPKFPALALLVSGGHTMLVLISGFRRYEIIAKTRDDAAGEAFDKIANVLGLPYPGGPALSLTAKEGYGSRYRFPVAMRSDMESFSFSGLKTAVFHTVRALGDGVNDKRTLANLAASSEQAIVDNLVEKCLPACRKYRPKSFLLTGGVAANRLLRSTLDEQLKKMDILFSVPPPKWCTDNAAMVAALGARIVERRAPEYAAWHAAKDRRGALGPDTPHDSGVLARWPLEELVEGHASA